MVWHKSSLLEQMAVWRCQNTELTVSLQLLLQPADLAGPGFLGDGLDLFGPGGYLQAGASSGINDLDGAGGGNDYWVNIWSPQSDGSIITSALRSRLTWFQFFLVPTGSFFHRFTRSTQALQISPDRVSLSLQDNLWWNDWEKKICLPPHTPPHVFSMDSYPKQLLKSFSYRLLSVKRELEDFALQMQQPSKLLYIFGLWKPNICVQKKRNDLCINISDSHQCACWLQYLPAASHAWLMAELIYIYTPFNINVKNQNLVFCHDRSALKKKHPGKEILLEHLSALTHMREVGQQSDSVSDRSCQHATLTGCTLHFGKLKIQART